MLVFRLTSLPLTHLASCTKTETVASLQAFRKRHSDAQRALDALRNQPTSVDLAKYRSTLKNQAIVDEADKIMKGFKPVTYEVKEMVKAIEAFEGKAVSLTSGVG